MLDLPSREPTNSPTVQKAISELSSVNNSFRESNRPAGPVPGGKTRVLSNVNRGVPSNCLPAIKVSVYVFVELLYSINPIPVLSNETLPVASVLDFLAYKI
jgi:hypothetical protein